MYAYPRSPNLSMLHTYIIGILATGNSRYKHTVGTKGDMLIVNTDNSRYKHTRYKQIFIIRGPPTYVTGRISRENESCLYLQTPAAVVLKPLGIYNKH